MKKRISKLGYLAIAAVLIVALVGWRIAYIELSTFGKPLPKPESEYDVSDACYKALGPESGIFERILESHKPENFKQRRKMRDKIEDDIVAILKSDFCSMEGIVYSLYKSGMKFSSGTKKIGKEDRIDVYMEYKNPYRYSRFIDTLWIHGKYQLYIHVQPNSSILNLRYNARIKTIHERPFAF